MDCNAFRQESEALETGKCPGATMQSHLDSCAPCRTFYAERLALRQLVGSLPTVVAPPDFDFRLRARIKAAKSKGSGAFSPARFAPGLKAITLAAAFVLLLTAAVVFKQFQSGLKTIAPSTSENSTARVADAQPQKSDNKSQPATLPAEDASALHKSREMVSKINDTFPMRSNIDSPAQSRGARPQLQSRATRPAVGSSDFMFGGTAPVITPVHPPATASAIDKESAALLQVSTQPVRVLLHDRQGAMRAVFLGPVIFGSQDIFERTALRNQPASDVEGVW